MFVHSSLLWRYTRPAASGSCRHTHPSYARDGAATTEIRALRPDRFAPSACNSRWPDAASSHAPVKSAQGSILVGIYDSADGFLKRPLKTAQVAAAAGPVSVVSVGVLTVFDAAGIKDGPVALARLPYRTPHCFHGNFLPA